ncbi:hypothetical protein C8R46DRAFT_1074732 [Mycena filopes]|nr:hypothetical protein C8R46DRAFT_1074732 [Mycena filopes]
MHPILHPRGISKLRISLRPVAAAAMNGSVKDVARLHVMARTMSGNEAFGLLPVFYANLDPQLVPSLDILDDIITTYTCLPSMENAQKALSSLSIILRPDNFPLEAAPELWARIWKWIEFLHLYYDCGPPLTTAEVFAIYLIHSQIILKFNQHPPSTAVMFATRGVRRILAVSWATGVHNYYKPEEPASLRVNALPLIALSHMEQPQDLEEVVDACGGTFTSLALTLIKNVSQAVEQAKFDMAAAVNAIAPVFFFLRDIMRISREFVACLLSHGIVASLVSALDINGITPEGRGMLAQPIEVGLGLGTLIQVLNQPPGYPWTVQALQAGLLRRVVAFEPRFATEADAGKFPDLLGTVLPRTLVSYTVIAEMRTVFLELESLSQSADFSRSALYGRWQTLQTLVHERGKILDAWEASGRASSLACYNMKCDKIDSRDFFRRCSVCCNASYCSRGCQQLDWKAGHRQECSILRYATRTYGEIGLHHNEKNFICALVDSEYRRLRVDIAMHILRFMTSYPGMPFFVAFDFTGASGVQYSVLPMSRLGFGADIPHWARLARAGGRLMLHAVRLGHGLNWSSVAFPLRATSSQFYDGLVEIANSEGVFELQYSQAEGLVRDLIERTDRQDNYREIH